MARMNEDITKEFFLWADSNNISREQIAEATGNNPKTVSTWRSLGIPKGKRAACFMFMQQLRKPADEIRHRLVHEPTREQFTRWNKAALATGKTIEDWAFDGLEAMADEFFSQPLEAVAEDKADYGKKTAEDEDQPA